MKNRKHRLSKSDFLKYQTCPQYLWLWKNKRDVVPQDNPEDVEHRLEQGNEVEGYARELFSRGVLLEGPPEKTKIDTDKAIKNGEKTIFQATVITEEGLLAKADVLAKNDDGSWTIYEVKSTTQIKDEHILDTAFQKAAFVRGGFDISHVELIYLNKNYVRHGKIMPKEIFISENVDERIAAVLSEVNLQLDDALDYIHKEEEPKTCSCNLKTKGKHCPTFAHFNPGVPEYSVFNLKRIGERKLGQLVDMEIYHVHEVPDDFELTEIQKNQVTVAKLGRPIIDKGRIAEELSKLKFPLYFLDYETISTAIPMYDGTKPYQQVPFQYSLHILNSPDDDKEEMAHCEFLARREDGFPVPNLLEQMKKDIGPTGTVIVWNKSFEMSRNEEMAKMFPEYKEFLLDVNSRVYDLMEIFSKQLHIHPDFHGSASIKYVLPVLAPHLSYKNLEIQNGGIACLRWFEAVAKDKDETEREEIYNNLLVYCGLDTLAMYEIYDHLVRL